MTKRKPAKPDPKPEAWEAIIGIDRFGQAIVIRRNAATSLYTVLIGGTAPRAPFGHLVDAYAYAERFVHQYVDRGDEPLRPLTYLKPPHTPRVQRSA